MLKTTWQEVKTTSIINCFRKAGFELTTVNIQEQENRQSSPEGMTEDEFESYVDLDGTVECHGALTDSDTVDAVLQKSQPEDSDSEEDDDSPPPPKTKPSAAYQAILVFRKFLEEQDVDLTNFYNSEQQLQEIIARKSKQQSLPKYFN